MNFAKRIGRWFSNMFTSKDIEEALGVTIATSEEMLEAQRLWRDVFTGNAPWNDSKIPSLMLASGICTEVARAVTIEAESEVVGSPRADWLNEQYQEFFEKIRTTTEKLTSNGTILVRPNIKDDVMMIEVFENNMYYPIRYDKQNKLVEVIFQYSITNDDGYYTLLEHCDFTNNEFSVEFTAWYSKNSERLGRQILLSEVPEWEYLEEMNGITFTDVENPWFVTLNMPMLNHIEQDSPQGVAIFSKSIDDLQKADEQEELTEHEFKAGRLKQNVTSDMLSKTASGEWNINKDVFNVFEGTGMPKDGFVDTYNPEFRHDGLNARQNDIKRTIEFNCGIGFGTISDPQTQAKTATEIESGNQRFYTTVSDIQKVLQNGLTELVAIMDDMATRYYLAPQGEYDISFWWDDSILVSAEDKQKMFDTELNRLKALQGIGAIDIAELRAFYKENSDYFSKLSSEMIEEARLELPSVFEEGVE